MPDDEKRSAPLAYPTARTADASSEGVRTGAHEGSDARDPRGKREQVDKSTTEAKRPADPPSPPADRGPPKVQLAPSVTLPKGGGALRSIGEKFQPSPFTGSGTLTVPLPTSPGRQGTGPQLTLSYASGGGNGPFGLGWSLSVPSVTRKTDKGLPLYQDGRESDVFILSGAEDLVPLLGPGGTLKDKVAFTRTGFTVYRYRPRTEGLFARIEQWISTTTGAMHWRAVTKDNVTSLYGLTAQARIVDPQHPQNVFEWLLEETRDDRGNIISYEYKEEDLGGVDVDAPEEHDRLAAESTQSNRYLKRIRYGNRLPNVADDWLFEVVLDYGEHGEWTGSPSELDVSPDEDRPWPVRLDTFSSHRSGFDIRTRRLCRRVMMFHHFEELASPVAATLVASTDLDYDEGGAFSYLVGVTQRGYIRDDETGNYVARATPTLELEYARPQIQSESVTIDLRELENMPIGIDGGTYRLEDLDGEGLPGVLTEQGGQLYFKRGLGDGGFAPMLAVRQVPTGMSLRGGGQLLDLDGDGVKDMVSFTRPLAGYYERTSDEGWERFRGFDTVPVVDMREPGLQLLDISGDGFPDMLVDRGDHFVWWRSRGREGFEGPLFVHKQTDERRGAPTLIYNDATTSLLMSDMTGDGLPDIVRIRNGDVCYWPSLGYGRFGARVVMRGAPVFDAPDQFRPDRIRTADIDGTGTTDLVYLGRHATTIWFNLAGNAFGPPNDVPVFPEVGALDSAQVLDLKGSGTACLVWSTPRLDGRAGRLKYVDLMGPTKPHLLIASVNNMGRETRVAYRSSTTDYVNDRDSGRPWITRLPFPVQVLARVETYDRIARTKLVNHFRYHHGHYDGAEREFRGFAMVEQWDTESFEDFGGSGLFTFDDLETVEENLHQPPVYTKSWFHTGAWIAGEAISQQLAAEYWQGDASAVQLPDTVLPTGLRGEELREACRVLRGSMLRQETYALDGSDRQELPYAVTERNFTIETVQRKQQGRHGVFFAHDRETLAYHYERIADDPRVMQSAVLAVDAYGNPTQTVQAAYARRGAAPQPEQEVASFVGSQTSFAALDDPDEDDYRVGVPYESRTWELTPSNTDTPLSFADLQTRFSAATELPFENPAAPTSGQKRLLAATRTFYYDDDLIGPAALGTAGIRALVHEQRAAAFSDNQRDVVFEGAVDSTLLVVEGAYVLEDDLWWTRSGRPVYDEDHFYLATSGIDPFNNTFTTTYDAYDLLPVAVADPLGNTVVAENDYRVLAPRMVTDPNENRAAVRFDELSVPVRTALMGKEGADEGDTLDDPTTQLDYDLFAYLNRGMPNVIHEQAREQHGEANPRWRESYTYFDGTGRVAMVKVQAEPGLVPQRDENGELVLEGSPPQPVLVPTSPDVPRWVGTGRTVYDNKGNPVKQYEPYFSSIPDFETEAELVEQGVTPLMHYDSLGRSIRVDLPNGTFSTTELLPWSVVTHDPNDNVLASDWYAERIALSPGDPERRAAELTAPHADTPTTVHLDGQGRAFLTIEHAGWDESSPSTPVGLFETRLTLDVVGNVLAVEDARGNLAEERIFGMLQQPLETSSVDAGMRRTIADVAGAPLRAWNSRDFTSRMVYDALRRPTHQWVTPPSAAEMLVVRTVWGEDVGSPVDDNLRTRVFRVYDAAGELTNVTYDFKGNLLQQQRRLTLEYETTQDWSLLDDASPPTAENIAALADAQLEDETFTFLMEYDALNRATSRTTPDDSETLLTYNEAGLLEAIDVRIRGAASPTNFVSDFDYNARGQRLSCIHGNGTVTTYEYDPETFRLSRLRLVRGDSPVTVLQDLRYTYDPVGNITQIRDFAQQEVFFDNTVVSPDQLFEYDSLYRLVSATGRELISLSQSTHADITFGPQPHPDDPAALRTYEESYVWDEVGNIIELQHVASGGNFTRQYVYADNGNRLLRNSAPGESVEPFSHSYTYDAHGNMTSMPHLAAMDWDHADRLQHCDLGGGGGVWFVYDASGERVRKVQVNTSGSTRRERIYLGPWETWRERSGSPMDLQQERQTLHVADDAGRICLVETLVVDNGGPVLPATPMQRYQHGNHLSSAALELDEDAAIISYEEYHPFGTSSYAANDSGSGVSAKRYRYIGKERDDETGLCHLGSRYYAPWLARWLAADPAGLMDGLNRYVYARGNPSTFLDDNGHAAQNPTESASQESPILWVATRGGLLVPSPADLQRMASSHPAPEVSRDLRRAGRYFALPDSADRRWERGGVRYSHSFLKASAERKLSAAGKLERPPLPDFRELSLAGAQVLDLGFGTRGTGRAATLQRAQKFVANPVHEGEKGAYLAPEFSPGEGAKGVTKFGLFIGNRPGRPVYSVGVQVAAINPSSEHAETTRLHEQSHFEQAIDIAVLATRELTPDTYKSDEKYEAFQQHIGRAQARIEDRYHGEIKNAYRVHGDEGERRVIEKWRDPTYRWERVLSAWEDTRGGAPTAPVKGKQ